MHLCLWPTLWACSAKSCSSAERTESVSDSEACESQTAGLSPSTESGSFGESSANTIFQTNLSTFEDLFRDIDFSNTRSQGANKQDQALELPVQDLDEILASSTEKVEQFETEINDESSMGSTELNGVMEVFSQDIGFDCPFDFETADDEEMGWFWEKWKLQKVGLKFRIEFIILIQNLLYLTIVNKTCYKSLSFQNYKWRRPSIKKLKIFSGIPILDLFRTLADKKE